jgi:hypothetical protein
MPASISMPLIDGIKDSFLGHDNSANFFFLSLKPTKNVPLLTAG